MHTITFPFRPQPQHISHRCIALQHKYSSFPLRCFPGGPRLCGLRHNRACGVYGRPQTRVPGLHSLPAKPDGRKAGWNRSNLPDPGYERIDLKFWPLGGWWSIRHRPSSQSVPEVFTRFVAAVLYFNNLKTAVVSLATNQPPSLPFPLRRNLKSTFLQLRPSFYQLATSLSPL